MEINSSEVSDLEPIYQYLHTSIFLPSLRNHYHWYYVYINVVYCRNLREYVHFLRGGTYLLDMNDDQINE